MDEEDDTDLWHRVTRDIKPLHRPAAPPDQKPAAPKPRRAPQQAQKTPDLERFPATAEPAPQPRQLDRRTEEKLRKGKMTIEGTLDLHGMTQARAQTALIDFTIAAQAAGKRCILVITGKGNSRKEAETWFENTPGILKQKLPHWVTIPPLDDLVLKHTQARPEHGGGGAFYLYLKRDR